MTTAPPWFARLLVRVLLPARDREFIIGDLEEEFALEQLPRRGSKAARRWYWRQALYSVLSEAKYRGDPTPDLQPGEPRRGSMFDAIRQDVRQAIRGLNRRPVFTTIAVITLALGIGANTAVFSIANWLLLRPVAGIRAPHELAIIEFAEAPGQTVGISWPNFAELEEGSRSFAGMAGVTTAGLQVLAPNAAPMNITAHVVGGDYFGVLGVGVQLGRPIQPGETVPGQHAAVAVISDALWTSMFQRSRNVLGRTIRANKLSFTIVGVAKPGFRGLERQGDIDVWLPLSMYAELRHMPDSLMYERRPGMMREIIGRLKPGVTGEAAQGELRTLMASIVERYPEQLGIYTERPTLVHEGIGLSPLMRERTEATVKLMLLVVLALLIISTSNVANMLLVRGVQRAPETAIRRVLGASMSRIAQQQWMESMALTLVAGIVALLVAKLFLGVIEGGRLLGLAPIADVPMDWRVLAFTFAVSIVAGLVFALTPLVVLYRSGMGRAISRASARLTPRGSWLRASIVTGQTALSLGLLVGALLLARTLNNLLKVDLGFDPDRIIGFSLNPEPQGYTVEQLPLIATRVLEQIRGLPDVERAAIVSSAPFSCCGFVGRVHDPLQRGDKPIEVTWKHISEGYFQAMDVPVLQGRVLEARDQIRPDAGERNIVLSQAAARRLFGDRDPLGQIVRSDHRTEPAPLRVVGVVRDVRMSSLLEPPEIVIYQPISVFPLNRFAVVVRPRQAAVGLAPAIQKAVSAVDAGLPIGQFGSASEQIGKSISEQRLLATMLWMFSALGVLLAAVGLYGVLSFSVSERTREIGIRMALGAQVRQILGLIAGQSLRIVGVGIIAGLLLAVWLTRLLESQLFGIGRLDAGTYIAAVLLFGLVAIAATAIPTRTATAVQPTTALRHE